MRSRRRVVVGVSGGLLLGGGEHVAGKYHTGDGEDSGPQHDAPANLVRLGAHELVFRFRHHSVVVEVAFEWRVQQQQNDRGGECDEDDVDAEFIQRPKEDPGIGSGESVARRAQWRHEAVATATPEMTVAGSWSRELPRPPAKPPTSASIRSI